MYRVIIVEYTFFNKYVTTECLFQFPYCMSTTLLHVFLRLIKFKGHNPSENLLRYVKMGGSNKKGESATALGPPRPPFLNT